MAKSVPAGPWGYPDGDGAQWSFDVPHGKIFKLTIVTGEWIFGFGFASKDDDGTIYQSGIYGGSVGVINTFEINTDVEELISISGTIGPSECFNPKMFVTSLQFKTNNGTVSPVYGTQVGTSFSFSTPNDKFTGFFGRSSNYLNAIGVFLNPV